MALMESRNIISELLKQQSARSGMKKWKVEEEEKEEEGTSQVHH